MENLKHKNYFIIGASSGIGSALADKLIASGANVYAGSRTKSQNSKVEWQYLDVSKPEFSIPNPLPESLHGFVYCPGSISLKPFSRISNEEFRATLELNVQGAFQAIKHVVPALKKSGEGSILLFSTIAVQTGMPFHASIAAAKGAIEGLTRALAAELAPNIRVNAIAPSLTETPLSTNLLNSEEKRTNAANRHPLKRIGTPADIAEAAYLLLTNPFITGQILPIDGGIGTLRT
jgi:NAD(P)-dependent dehydrogenase (short-subunit alcohol dehydrogenase family)